MASADSDDTCFCLEELAGDLSLHEPCGGVFHLACAEQIARAKMDAGNQAPGLRAELAAAAVLRNIELRVRHVCQPQPYRSTLPQQLRP
jgi:hypothetical protein